MSLRRKTAQDGFSHSLKQKQVFPPPRHHPKHQRVFLVSAMLSILANERMVAIVDDVWHIDVTFLRQGLTL